MAMRLAAAIVAIVRTGQMGSMRQSEGVIYLTPLRLSTICVQFSVAVLAAGMRLSMGSNYRTCTEQFDIVVIRKRQSTRLRQNTDECINL